MFDFVNMTYSGLLSVVVAIIGLSCPLIIGRIENIDKHYSSTLLAKRFITETAFVLFAVCMVINILVATLFPFVLDCSEYARIWIAVQSILVFLLIVSLLLLFYYMLIYTSPENLSEHIISHYNKVKKKDKKKAEMFFLQWIDVTPSLLISADYDLTQSVYDKLYDYVKDFYSDGDKCEKFDDYFLTGITRINENICQKEHRLISLNNSNTLLTMFIEYIYTIPLDHYKFLWKNLQLQIHYGQEEWIMSYWEIASQRYQIAKMSNGEENRRNDKLWDFYEFHLMLVAMLLQEHKYDLVKRVLSFSNTRPEEYPLIPSTISEVLNVLNTINSTSNSPGKYLYYELRYPMSKMHGISDGKILGAIYLYLALLMYRVLTLPQYYGEEHALNIGININQTNLHELRIWRESLQIMRFWLKTVDGSNLMKMIEYNSRQELTRDEYKNKLEDIIKKAELIIDNTADKINEEQEYSSTVVNTIEEGMVNKLKSSFTPYETLLNQSSLSDNALKLNCSSTSEFPNKAFIDNADISYVNIDDVMAQMSIYRFVFEINKLFLLNTHGISYRVAREDLPKAFSNLDLDEEYVVFSFGNNLGDIFNKVKDEELKYGNTLIYELPTYQRMLERVLYVIKKEDLPNVRFEKPDQKLIDTYQLKCVDEYFQIWTSLLKLKDFPELKPKETTEKNLDQCSLLTVGWQPVINIKKDIEVLKIKVWYRFLDEGNPDDVNAIKPIEKKSSTKTDNI